MRMKSLGPEFVRAWWEKVYTLLVSGKMLLFWGATILSTILLYFDIINMVIWGKVMITNITVVGGLRGAVEIASLIKKGKINTLIDDASKEGDENVRNITKR